MKTKSLLITIWIILCVTILFGGEHQKSCSCCIDKKVETLLTKMTLEEKIGQMTQYSDMTEDYKAWIRQGRVGSMLNIKGVKSINALQKIAIEESRLGIPLIFGLDVIHGYRTIFPISLAEAATWDPELVEESARIAAKEATAAGIHWTFAPMVDIARDARWGRIAEGAGEDPYLGSIMAVARVRGFQGNGLTDPNTLAACAKHYAAYGAAEGGMDYNTVDMSIRTLREIYLPPFKAAVDAGVSTLMSAFNEINGIPATGNKFILNDILRQQWGFKGIVVSDWSSIQEMLNHGNVGTPQEAGKLALEAGVDMEMMSGIYHKHFIDMAKQGKISIEQIDESVRRILRIKFKLGLFDSPYADPEREKKELLAEQHLKFAREISANSIVLLKNDGNLLPLDKNIKSVAIIGPLVKSKQAPLGWWHCDGKAEDVIPAFQGIKNKLSSKTKIEYTKGCDITGGDKQDFKNAVAIAKNAAVAILVVGEDYDMSGEGASRANIGLPGHQLDLVKAVYETKTPIVIVLMNGRPLAIPWIAEHVPAIVESWQLGSQCGNAIADVLFGDVNPSAKLPVTFPRSVGQEPLYYNHKNTGRPPADNRFTARYIDIPIGPLFPFGYGLSYTKFEYSDLAVSHNKIAPHGSVTVSVNVKNVGKLPGDEIAQLYIQDVVASVTRPVKELKGFQKVTLKPSETKRIEFTLVHAHLGFYNQHLEYVVEPGVFKVWIGPNSAEGLAGSFEVIE